jgi:hypothetical protein
VAQNGAWSAGKQRGRLAGKRSWGRIKDCIDARVLAVKKSSRDHPTYRGGADPGLNELAASDATTLKPGDGRHPLLPAARNDQKIPHPQD